MAIMSYDEIPIQDERLSPYGLPNSINPIKAGFTLFGLEVLDTVDNVKSLVNSTNKAMFDTIDGAFNESPQVSAPLSDQARQRAQEIYPGMEIGQEASREQLEAAIDRYQRQQAIDYVRRHASPGFASEAAMFTGELAASLANIPALKGASWMTKAIARGSEGLAMRSAESAVARLGGVESVKAQQIIADNAGKLGALKVGAGFGTYAAIDEVIREGVPHMSGVLTPDEADYKILDGVFNIMSSSLTGATLGLAAEKFTGLVVDKAFVGKTSAENLREFEEWRKNRKRPMSYADMMQARYGDEIKLHSMGGDTGISDNIKKTASVIRDFFKSNKESTERETLDNVSNALETGVEPHSDFLHEVNRHDAWQRLQDHLKANEITPDDFIESLEKHRPELIAKLEVDNPSIEDLQQLGINESMIELAKMTEADATPSNATKDAFVRSMTENKIKLDGVEEPYFNFDEIEKGDRTSILDKRLTAYSDPEISAYAENPYNDYARSAIKRKALLQYEKPLASFIATYGNQIARELESGIELTPEYLRQFFDFLEGSDFEGIQNLLDANKTDIDFLLEHINDLFKNVGRQGVESALDLTPEQLANAIKNQFDYIKAQVIRSQLDAVAFDKKLQVMQNAVDALDTTDGTGIKQGINAILDRSLLEFKGANSGTYRLMNLYEQKFNVALTNALTEADALHFWNDPNSSTEISRAIYNQDMGLPMDEVSPIAQKTASIIKQFYDVVHDMYARQGVLIPKLKGRIHYQWHNPMRIMRMSLRDRIKLSRFEREEKAFNDWHDEIVDRIDWDKTFDQDVVEPDDPSTIDPSNPEHIRAFLRRTFDKIIKSDYRREKTNLLTKRSRQRVLQFKSPEDFAAYTKKYGAGSAQDSINRELTGMFREVALIEHWGAEPEKMLTAVLEHSKSLPGWNEYTARSKNDQDTPTRLMHMMRFGAAHSGTIFAEVVYNLKAYESVTKLGNLLFLNFSDALTSANALSRLNIPMTTSIAKSIKETFSRYTPEQQADVMRMFGVAKEQYFGRFYRHFEDGTLSANLSKMIRTVMKITGTQNSEYSNRSMVGQSISTWFAQNLRGKFEAVDAQSKATLARYDIGQHEWALLKHAIRKYKGSDYVGWDTVHELTDAQMTAYMRKIGIKDITAERIEITRDDMAHRYQLLMQDQMDDALNRKSLIESDLLRFKRRADEPSVINDAINLMMLFKTYGFMWIRRHVGDRMYGRGAKSFRISQLQGTADWHGLMKLMGMSFAMEYAINEMKSLANTGKSQPLNHDTMIDAMLGSLGPIAYLSRLEGDNLTTSIFKIAGGPVMGDIDRIARLATQFERGFWRGDYSTAKVNSIKLLASQFGGIPLAKAAILALFADNLNQNQRGKRIGHVLDTVMAKQEGTTP